MTSLTALTLVPVAPAIATEVAPPQTVTTTVEGLRLATDPEGADVASDLQAVEPARTEPVVTEVSFSTIGLRLPPGLEELQIRTRDLDGVWNEWLDIDRVDAVLDGPDADSPEAATAASDVTEPIWVGPSDAFQLTFDADAVTCDGCDIGDQIEAILVDTLGANESTLAKVVRHLTPRPVVAPAEATAARPTIISRAGWGANESIRRGSPSYRTPTFAVLHHTAGSNNYTRAQSAAVVRGIYHYHAQTLGWGDIGYNILVDRYGQIFEGRFGGLDRGVIGAHARGYNTGSFGVSVMGNFDIADVPSAALESVARVSAWKYDVHGIDRSASRTMTVNGTRINTFTSHRNVGQTACPGRYLYARMGHLRSRIASLATGISPAGSTRFRDVPASHPHYTAIETIAVRRITEGCAPGFYCPSDPVVRAQMASFLVRALDLPAVSGTPFRDIDSGPHASAVASLAAAGITTGCEPRRFCPNAPVTRGQMATFIARGFEVPRTPSRFPDVPRGHTHDGAIGGLVEAGIASGYRDGSFRPSQPVTRAEMAAFLARALAWAAKQA
ncbi:S-layer homology domain-containing protein [Nitriliruptor alkaliphilus]|uniref:S-layer homology domain-containing protein n=1 Tax=Nitriliruptor alkaliphilus TaxID=427918 RepID=UPI0012EE0D01|nr:S-layer homology domain-containing protein [Nitriliruptor alkaliphilus]